MGIEVASMSWQLYTALWCMRQVLRAGVLGRPRGMGWRGRREGASGWGTHVNPWLIHVNVWQKPLQYYKVISLQLIKINEKKKKKINQLLYLSERISDQINKKGSMSDKQAQQSSLFMNCKHFRSSELFSYFGHSLLYSQLNPPPFSYLPSLTGFLCCLWVLAMTQQVTSALSLGLYNKLVKSFTRTKLKRRYLQGDSFNVKGVFKSPSWSLGN